jgi:hypothetical protein
MGLFCMSRRYEAQSKLLMKAWQLRSSTPIQTNTPPNQPAKLMGMQSHQSRHRGNQSTLIKGNKSNSSFKVQLVLAVLMACAPALLAPKAAIAQTKDASTSTSPAESLLKTAPGEFFQQKPGEEVPAKPVILQPDSRLAVIRGDQAEWGAIVQTLEGVKYKTIALDNLSAASLENVDVLFLPNVAAMTVDQVAVLNNWMDNGGYVITSGTIGSAAQPEARMKLRSLIGGYWSSNLNKVSHLLPRTSQEYGWAQNVPEIGSQKISNGGVLSPTLSTSKTIAFWPDNRVAALQTEKSVYLGWQWGTETEQQEYDRFWLLSALNNQYDQQNQANQVAISDRDQTTSSTPVATAATTSKPSSPTSARGLTPAAPTATKAPEPASRPTVTQTSQTSPTARTTVTPTRKQAISNTPQSRSTPGTTATSNITSHTTTNSVASTPASPTDNKPPSDRDNSTSKPDRTNNQANNRSNTTTTSSSPTARKSATNPTVTNLANLSNTASRSSTSSSVTNSSTPTKPIFTPSSPAPTVSKTDTSRDRANTSNRTIHPLARQSNSYTNNSNNRAKPVPTTARVVEPPAPSVPVLPVNTLEAISMRQELKEIMGRVENAIISAEIAKASQGDVDTSKIREIAAADAITQGNVQLGAGRQTHRGAIALSVRYAKICCLAIPMASLPPARSTGNLARSRHDRCFWIGAGLSPGVRSHGGSRRKYRLSLKLLMQAIPIYPSSVAPQQNPLTRGWDPLAASVKLAHERNMELHAWVWVFGVGNKRHNPLVGKPVSYPGPVLEVIRNGQIKIVAVASLRPKVKLFLILPTPKCKTI